MPDADKEATINAIVGAAFGAAGQRYGSLWRWCVLCSERGIMHVRLCWFEGYFRAFES
jgi:acyl-CoA reductase-like NAD-dependent aldehyde dehydrogenase